MSTRFTEGGGAGGGATTIGGLNDVSTSNVQPNEILKYNSTSGAWENAALNITGGLTYKGDLDATNPPDLSNANQGDFYVISVPGTRFGRDWEVGDHLLVNEDMGGAVTDSKIDKVDNTEPAIFADNVNLRPTLEGNGLTVDVSGGTGSSSQLKVVESQLDNATIQNGAGYITGVAALDDIGDVTITNATNDYEVVRYDSGNFRWINAQLTAAQVDNSAGTFLENINNESLDDLSDVTLTNPADGHIIVSDASGNFANEAPATARTSLGLAIGSDVQAFDATLNSLAGLANPAADSLVQVDSSGNASYVLSSSVGGSLATSIDGSSTNTSQTLVPNTAYYFYGPNTRTATLTTPLLSALSNGDEIRIVAPRPNITFRFDVPAGSTNAGIFRGGHNTQSYNTSAGGTFDLTLNGQSISLVYVSTLSAFVMDLQTDKLNSLGDVTLTNPADGHIIVSDASGNFANEAPATARTSLGLAIGSDVQAFDATLNSLAGLANPAADSLVQVDISGNASYVLSSSVGGASALDDLSDVTLTNPADGHIIVSDASGNFANEAPATARTSLGLGTAATSDTTAFLSGTGADTLGGDLDVGSSSIVSSSNADIAISPNGTGQILLDGDGTTANGGVSIQNGLVDVKNNGTGPSEIRLYCESSNAHYVGIKSAPHGAGSANYALSLPEALPGSAQYLKTDTSGNLSWDTPAGGGASRPSVDTSLDHVGSPHSLTAPASSSTLEEIYIVDSSGGAVTINLPAVTAALEGFKYNIKRVGANNVVIAANGTNTIEDSTNDQTLSVDYSALTLVCDGSAGWYII